MRMARKLLLLFKCTSLHVRLSVLHYIFAHIARIRVTRFQIALRGNVTLVASNMLLVRVRTLKIF